LWDGQGGRVIRVKGRTGPSFLKQVGGWRGKARPSGTLLKTSVKGRCGEVLTANFQAACGEGEVYLYTENFALVVEM